ncbi:hypothetical protein LXL04_025553 [Taraxacum kok-saghyz]
MLWWDMSENQCVDKYQGHYRFLLRVTEHFRHGMKKKPTYRSSDRCNTKWSHWGSGTNNTTIFTSCASDGHVGIHFDDYNGDLLEAPPFSSFLISEVSFLFAIVNLWPGLGPEGGTGLPLGSIAANKLRLDMFRFPYWYMKSVA